MDVLIYIGIGVVALWVLSKIVSSVMDRAVVRRIHRRPEAAAIRTVVTRAGRFDGSSRARDSAFAAFVDLALNGPYPIGPGWDVHDTADACVHLLGPASGPILVETAWSVAGTHDRSRHVTDEAPVTAAEKDWEAYTASVFTFLYPDWLKEMSRKYPATSVAAVRAYRRRMRMVVEILLDRAAREENGLVH